MRSARWRRPLWPLLMVTLVAGIAAGLLSESASRGAVAPSKYLSDLAAFYKEVDEGYPFFDLKGVRKDWEATKKRLAVKVRLCQTDSEFLGLVIEAMRALCDAHMTLEKPQAEIPMPPQQYCSGIAFLPGVKNTVLVMYPPKGFEAQLRIGTIVVSIDGNPARAVLDELAKRAWAEGGFFSSPQRARLFEYRMPLRGKQGEKHVIGYLDGGKARKVTLSNTVERAAGAHLQHAEGPETRGTLVLLRAPAERHRLHVHPPRR